MTWRPTGRGLYEIDGVPDQVLRHFSQRRVEIEQRAAELVGAGTAHLSRERMQAIALQTRHAKRYGVDGGTWREQARARAAEHGLGTPELTELTGRIPGPVRRPMAAHIAARLSGALGLTERHNTFARRHALAEIAGEFDQGAALEHVEVATSRYLADASVQQLRDGDDGQRYTTVGLLACERTIIDGAARRRHEQTALLTTEAIAAVLASSHPRLTSEQAATVQALTTSGHGVDAVTAVAGSGKTTMIGALTTCYRDQGWRVFGAAPTARAARQLRDTAAIPADTMHALLLRLTRAGGFPSRTVLVLDEAGMAPTRLTTRLFNLAERAGAKVIAVGDPGQLGSVDAGGWLAAITANQSQPTLTTAIRQHDPAERDALQALHDGDPDTYLQHKQPDITIHERETSAIATLVNEWHGARARHGPAQVAMIARDNHTRELANRAARARLKTIGALPHSGVFIGGREYAPGDRVIARRNDPLHDIDNGALGTISAIDPHSGAMIIQLDTGPPRALDATYAADHLEHAYALDHDSDIAAHWGEALWQSGKHQEARRVWAAAVARGADAPLLKTTMARFLSDAP